MNWLKKQQRRKEFKTWMKQNLYHLKNRYDGILWSINELVHVQENLKFHEFVKESAIRPILLRPLPTKQVNSKPTYVSIEPLVTKIYFKKLKHISFFFEQAIQHAQTWQ